MRMFLIVCILLESVFASAGCIEDALKESQIDPLTSYNTTPGIPNENGEKEINIEIRGEVRGSLIVVCDSAGEFIKISQPYSEEAQ